MGWTGWTPPAPGNLSPWRKTSLQPSACASALGVRLCMVTSQSSGDVTVMGWTHKVRS